MLRLYQALGDTRPQAGHRYPLLAALQRDHSSLVDHGGRRIRRCHLARLVGLQERHHVCFGQPAVLAGPGDHRSVEIVLLEQATDRRTRLDRFRGARFGHRLGCRFGHGRLHGPVDFDRLSLGQHRQDLTRGNRRAVTDPDLLEHAARRCGNLENDLVGFEIDEILVATDRFADALVPRDERRIAHGLGQSRYLDLYTHLVFRFFLRGLADLLALASMPRAASTSACCCCK